MLLNKLACVSIAATLLFSLSTFAQIWEPGPTLPTNSLAKIHAIGVTSNGTIYAMGGPPWINGTEDGSVFSLAPAATAWVQELGFDGYGGLIAQGGGQDALGRIIIFGGDDPFNPGSNKPPFEWNPIEGPWHQHAARNPLAPRTYFAYCTDDFGRIYSLGGGPGEAATTLDPNSNFAERFIGNADVWEVIAPLPLAVGDAAAAYDGMGHILVFGGVSADGSTRNSAVQQYDIATNVWSTTMVPDMPSALSGHRAMRGADGRIYVMGGATGPIGTETILSEVHAYNPLTNTWSIAPSMSTPRRWFATALGPDDHIYAIGGDNATGGTNAVEHIYTTPCPGFNQQPADSTLWRGGTIAFQTVVSGGGTITYQWKVDGQPLSDGPSAGGGTITGAQATSLTITQSIATDAGSYTLEATNTCGTTTSSPALVTIQIPPAIPTNWTVTNLHPAWAQQSYAYAVDNGVQVGNAVFDTPEYNMIDHPFMWQGSAQSVQDLTPAGSQGGVIDDIAGNYMVGWWWEPVQCYINGQWYTCYYRRGSTWRLDGTHLPSTFSGWEYSTILGTNGTNHVGRVWRDDAGGNITNHAYMWMPPNYTSGIDLHPATASVSNSYLTAIDGIYQYGTILTPFPGPSPHAAKWAGSRNTYEDMHPMVATNSSITDASDGQQVGTINLWNNPHAALWAGSYLSFVDLNPVGADSSSLSACEGGLQIGTVTFQGQPASPCIWASSKDTFLDMAPYKPAGFSSITINDLDIEADGTIVLVGSGYNIANARSEALVWRSSPTNPCPADLNNDGVVDVLDFFAFVTLFNASDPQADLNADGNIDVLDFFVFITAFNNGC